MIRTKKELRLWISAGDAVIILGEEISGLPSRKAEAETDQLERLRFCKLLEPRSRSCTYTTDLLAGKSSYTGLHLAVTTELNPWVHLALARMDQHLIKYYGLNTEAGIAR